ncbi:AAA family ATPase [Herbaspirillum sp. SJZ107]|uniref:AAA family ATPase n=1 Tax=Herbaspirillum sp. SJZ107 TaxID=2572881 RepID=UPI00114F76F8|nr:AAA family ATPase [Herbaspirillum sp. SJZ107]TQK08187.1 exonuclease SbcC [Herbaspirillum sp. SJZ107]
MKILRIGGKNLASLAGEFAVDFESEPLASSGLFAISGPTGAGKSTLLDALCLALYDATPRLLKARAGNQVPDVGADTVQAHDRRTLLRRGAAEGYAEVDFIGNDGIAYRARWSVRRSYNKATGALQGVNMSLHKLPELAPLGNTKTETLAEIEKRIGLSFEQFTRSVLLAQNEFSAFLRTDDNERGELLETLTGSAVYSEISRRAFERWRTEQEAMRRLAGRLQDQAPLAPEQRSTLDEEHTVAQAALTAVDARRSALEQQLRWYQALDKLAQGEAQADTALAAATTALDAAAQRRRHLATLDAVQPARALVAELQRLAGEQRQAQLALENGEKDLARALDAQKAAAQAQIDAERKLEAAEQVQRQQAPLLDRAKALDATLATLAPAHAKARSTLDAAAAEARQAGQVLAAKTAELDEARRTLADTRTWLEVRRDLDGLAAQWERWEQRLLQAEQAAAQDTASAAALARARTGLDQAEAAAQRTAAALGAATTLLQEREATRAQAIEALDGIDADALRGERRALETRRERLAAFGAIHNALDTAHKQSAKLEVQAERQQAAQTAAAAALEAARTAGGAIDAALAQAERMFEAAQLACADGVESLRDRLGHGTPCPVCGSEEHPYRHQDVRLHTLLDKMAEEVAARRREQRDNLNEQAQQQAALDTAAERLRALLDERTGMLDAIAQLEEELAASPLAGEAPEAEDRGAWLTTQQGLLRDGAAGIDAREQALRRAELARDAAQQAWDSTHREQARLLDAAQAAQAQLNSLETDIATLAAKRDAAAETLAGLLAELDPVLVEACGAGWQTDWRQDPAGWRQQRAGAAREWAERAARVTRLESAISTFEAEHAAMRARVQQDQGRLAEAQAEFERIELESSTLRRERAQLFDGRAAREVEQALAAGVAAAREGVNAGQAASLQAAQSEARVREAQAKTQERIAVLQDASGDTNARLNAWFEDFDGNDPDLEPVDSEQALAALLAVGNAWIAQERTALGELDSQARQAAAVLAERRMQRQQHQELAPPDAASRDAAGVAQDLAAAEQERRTVHETAAALALRIREDDARRERARSMMAEIERQRAIEERWARLADLIGSADGKKFRNYAQQFTLDVLLGYANQHLAQLARRYRLERVANGSGPSLALMVRDQDMGGEVRSVNSLSGGESFLVSLALALGLASLSSNRVKVESLFIDEGFGSLDSDTLGVAMDALDALQSMGRKVGVISHVQEMTERIATKVMVRPGGGGSSSITVQ